jgi:hypothetical protein
MCNVGNRQKIKSQAGLLLLLLISAGLPKIGFAQSSPENELKAVFLLNFVRYVEWPASAFASSNSPIVIGVLGNDPFRGALDKAAKGEKVRDRKIVVRHLESTEDARDCHLLFVSADGRSRMREITTRLSGLPILTASDTEGFLETGGMICLCPGPNQKLKIVIQIDKVKSAGLSVSSKLLGLAEVRGKPRRVPRGGAFNLWPESETTSSIGFTQPLLIMILFCRRGTHWI